MRLFILFFIIMFISFSNPLLSFETSETIIHPNNKTISNKNPVFIWQDLYQNRDTRTSHKFRITIYSDSWSKSIIKFCYPIKMHDTLYTFQLKDPLPDGNYNYKIDHIVSKKPTKSRYTAYLNYPIQGFFSIDSNQKNKFDYLSAENQTEYLHLEHTNLIENGYNSLFYAGASVGAAGLGYLFYKVLTYGKITDIIAYICFGSAIIGAGATVYYTEEYISGQNELNKIYEKGNISLNLNINEQFIKSSISYSY